MPDRYFFWFQDYSNRKHCWSVLTVSQWIQDRLCAVFLYFNTYEQYVGIITRGASSTVGWFMQFGIVNDTEKVVLWTFLDRTSVVLLTSPTAFLSTFYLMQFIDKWDGGILYCDQQNLNIIRVNQLPKGGRVSPKLFSNQRQREQLNNIYFWPLIIFNERLRVYLIKWLNYILPENCFSI